MSLEDRVNQWIEEQRRILVDRNKTRATDRNARKATFLGLNKDGTSRIRADGKDLSTKTIGDLYSYKNESVYLDDGNIVEKRRRKRPSKPQAKKGKIKGKALEKKKDLDEDIEEPTAGVFFGYSSDLVLGINLRLHALHLHELHSQFENIGFIYNQNLYEGNGFQPYLQAINIDLDTTQITHDGTLFTGYDIYNEILGTFVANVKISAYGLEDMRNEISWLVETPNEYPDSWYAYTLRENLRSEFSEDGGQAFLELIDNIDIVPFTGTVTRWHNAPALGEDLFNEVEIDPIDNGLNVIYATALDWPWRVQGWPHAPNSFDGSNEELCVQPICPGNPTRCEIIKSSSGSGTDEVFPVRYLLTPLIYEFDWSIGSYTSSPEIKPCRPSDPESYPCGPCNCGSGFFFCNYYTWAYRQCTPPGSTEIVWGCSPLTGEIIVGNGTLLSQTGGRDRRLMPRLSAIKAHSGTYPVIGFDENDYDTILDEDYTEKDLLSLRSSLISTLQRAKEAGYYIFFNFDIRFCVASASSSTNLKTIAPLTGDSRGLLTAEHTMISFLENLSKEAFIYKSSTYESRVNYLLGELDLNDPLLEQLNQELDILRDSYNNTFEKMYNDYGPAENADFDSVRVFNCLVTRSSDFHVSPALTNITIPLKTEAGSLSGPLIIDGQGSGTFTTTAVLLKHIEEAVDWYLVTAPPEALAEKPTADEDKYYYVLFGMMCGLFTREQLLSKDLEGDEKYTFQ